MSQDEAGKKARELAVELYPVNLMRTEEQSKLVRAARRQIEEVFLKAHTLGLAEGRAERWEWVRYGITEGVIYGIHNEAKYGDRKQTHEVIDECVTDTFAKIRDCETPPQTEGEK